MNTSKKTGIKSSATIELLEKTINLFNNLLDKLNEEIFEPYINNDSEKLEKNMAKIGQNCSLLQVVRIMLSGLKTLIPIIQKFPLIDDGPSITEQDEIFSDNYIRTMERILAEDKAKKKADNSYMHPSVAI